jgi:hypothetical protein
MAGNPLERSKDLMRDIGAALVAWSTVENQWNRIFSWMLFHKISKTPEHPRGDEPSEEELRANAMWDALTSSAAQLDLIVAIAPLVLNERSQEAGLEYLLKLVGETNKTRGLRNAIAHGPFAYNWTQTGMGFITPSGLGLGERPHKHMRGKDPYLEVPRIRDEFDVLCRKITALRFWLLTGRWVAGEPTFVEKYAPRSDPPEAIHPARDPSRR